MTHKPPELPFLEHRTCLTLTRLTVDILPRDRPLGQSRRFGKNSTLWRPDDRADRIYFLESGAVAIVSSDLKGNELLLQSVTSGDAFGELCFCAQGKGLRNTTARAVSAVSVREIPYEAFVKELLTRPELLSSLVYTFCLRLSDCEVRTEILAQRGAEERIGRLLLHLAAGPLASPDARQLAWVVIGVAHTEIARMAAMSRPHVTVTLGKFRRLRIVEYARGRPISINLPGLTAHLTALASRSAR